MLRLRLPAGPGPPSPTLTSPSLQYIDRPQVVGNSNVSVVDTWWQTETGAHMITPLPGATPLKPGSGACAGALPLLQLACLPA